MKKFAVPLLPVAFLWVYLVFFPVPLRADSNASLSLSGHYSHRLSGFIGHNNGLGGSLLLEYLPVESFSVGVGLGLTQYFGFSTPGTSQVESVDLLGRVLFNPGEPWTFYLMIGGGLNPKVDLQGDYLWGGDFHVLSGLGVWCPLSKQWALDIGAAYHYYDSPGDPLQAVQARMGLGYFFSPAFKEPQASKPAPVPSKEPAATPVETPSSTPLSVAPAATAAPTATPATAVSRTKPVHTAAKTPAAPAPVATAASPAAPAPVSTPTAAPQSGLPREVTAPRGYSLWEISAMPEVYGDPELYPLLVDANRKTVKPIRIAVDAGTKLAVPRDVSQVAIKKARINAWTDKYKQYRGRGLTRAAYQNWRKAHGLQKK